jgi:hypothetical protein
MLSRGYDKLHSGGAEAGVLIGMGLTEKWAARMCAPTARAEPW